MRDKKNKIRYVVRIANNEYNFVASDSYYKSINGGESATALQNLKDPNEIKYADCGNREKTFFNYIDRSFLKEARDIENKIGVIDTPVKMIELVTQKCRLFKEYCDRFTEQGLTLVNISKIPNFPEKESVSSHFLMCLMDMYADCQKTITKNIYNDVRDQAAGLNICATQILAGSAMLAIGSAEKRVRDFLINENRYVSDEVVREEMGKYTHTVPQPTINYNALKKSVDAEIDGEINVDALDDFHMIDNLRPLSPDETRLLNNVAERAFITDGMEVGFNNTNPRSPQDMLTKGTFLTPVNSILMLDEKIKGIDEPVRY